MCKYIWRKNLMCFDNDFCIPNRLYIYAEPRIHATCILRKMFFFWVEVHIVRR